MTNLGYLERRDVEALIDVGDWILEGPENDRALEILGNRDRVRRLAYVFHRFRWINGEWPRADFRRVALLLRFCRLSDAGRELD